MSNPVPYAAIRARLLAKLLSQFLTDYPARMFLMAGTSHRALASRLPSFHFGADE